MSRTNVQDDVNESYFASASAKEVYSADKSATSAAISA